MNVRNDFGKLFIYLFIASSIPRVGDTSISATARSISSRATLLLMTAHYPSV